MKKLLGAALAFGIFATLCVSLHPLFAQTTPTAAPPTAVACAFNSPLLADALTGNAIWVQCDAKGRLILSSSPSSPVSVQPPIPAVVVTGQAIIAVTNTAVQLPSNVLVNGLVVKAKSTNSASCGTVGKSGTTNTYDGMGNGYGLCPGEASSFAIPNSNLIFVNGTAGDIFTFEGN